MDSEPSNFLADDPFDWSAEAAACDLVSPLEVFSGWYYQQPLFVQQIVAREASRLLSLDESYRQVDACDSPSFNCFGTWLWLVGSEPHQTMARIFILRGMLDIVIFQHRGTEDGWSLHGDELRRLDDLANPWAGQELPTNVRPSPPVDPGTRTKQWMESAASWRRFRNSMVGDEALQTWLEIVLWQRKCHATEHH